MPGPGVLSGAGYFAKPARPNVPLRDKLSLVWNLLAGSTVFMGLFLLLVDYLDEQKRKRREIEADVYESAD